MAEILRRESDSEYRYQITRTDRGILVSCRQKTQLGLMLGPTEWLYQTEEAAEKGLATVMLIHAYWRAVTHGYPIGDLADRCEKAGAAHKEVIARLNDQPLMGREVRELRLAAEEE